MLTSPRVAVTALFVLSGAVYSSWAARIPAVKTALDLGDGDLAIALWGFAGGAVVAMPVVTASIRRYGDRAVCRLVAPTFVATLTLPGVAGSRGQLVAALVAMGACNGALDVAMNASGVGLQRTRVRPLMQSLHGGYGVGLAGGGLVGAGAAAIGAPVRWHLLVAAAVLLAVAMPVTRRLPTSSPAAHVPSQPAAHVPSQPAERGPVARRLAPVLAFATCAAFVEVSLTEWGGVYVQSIGGSPATAAAAFAVLAVTMTLGRLLGDRPLARLGPRGVRIGALATATALTAALASGGPGHFLVAMAICGVGVAWAFPAAIVAADQAAGGPGIALVSTAAYAAALIGPPLLGLIAEVASLTQAFVLIAIAAAASAVLAGSLSRGRVASTP